MSLSTSGIAATLSPMRAAHITQFYNLLTGQMTDQPVTLKNSLTVGGNQSLSESNLTLQGQTSQTGYAAQVMRDLVDPYPRFAVNTSGQLWWGPGSGTVDTKLSRDSAGYLEVTKGFLFNAATSNTPPANSTGYFFFKTDGLPYYRSKNSGGVDSNDQALAVAGTYDILIAQVFGG